MSLKLKLKMLSRKMKIIGNMDPNYKGIAMHSVMSEYILKGIFLYFCKYYKTELSIIFVDIHNEKVIWYNKPFYQKSGRAILCFDCKCMCIRRTEQNISILSDNKNSSSSICNMISNFSLFDDENIIYNSQFIDKNIQPTKDISVCVSLLNYILPDTEYATVKQSETMRLTLGEYIYGYLMQNNNPHDLEQEFTKYIDDFEKTVYVMC